MHTCEGIHFGQWYSYIFFFPEAAEAQSLMHFQMYALCCYCLCTGNRTIECFGLEGTFRGHLAQPPCSEQGHLPLDEAAQSPVQPGLECFQGRVLHYLSGQPVPVFHHPYHKNFLPFI